MTRLSREEIALRGGRATVICAEGEEVKFRLVYRKDEWDEDEWIMVNSEGGRAVLQIRRKLELRDCGELIRALEGILESVDELGGYVLGREGEGKEKKEG